MKQDIKVYFTGIIFLISTVMLNAQTIGWRGPGQSGIYNETGLLKSWPEGGPAMLWETEGIGIGYSSPAVTNDLIYITGVKGERDVLTALTQDGKKKWDIEYGNKSKVSTYPESRCTPTFYNGKIFVVSGAGELACVSSAGKLL